MSTTSMSTTSMSTTTEPVLARADDPTVPAHGAVTAAEPSGGSSLGYSPDAFVDDDSWAKPRPVQNKRLVWVAGLMTMVAVGLGTFTLGAKLGKDSTKTSTGGNARSALAAAFGGAGGLGGFGGAGGAGGFGRNRGGGTGTAATGAGAGATGSAAGTSQADILAGLLAGGGTGATGGASTAPAVQGTVTKVDATSITVTKADGTTVVITIDNKAEIARRAKAALADVKVGDNVAATGTTDSVGNVAAVEVTLGDLPAADAAAAAATTTDTTPTPNTSANLGGLLGG